MFPPSRGKVTRRANAPVFVVGSPRSGTTLAYHMLLSSGRFAIYRAETHVFSTLAPRFGPLTEPLNRRAMTECFIRSDMFRVSGLVADDFRRDTESHVRNAGDFLRIFMEAIARQQNVERWAETTPVHVLYAARIKSMIPDALFLNVVRDGRDVAVSMMKQGWVRSFPFDAGRPEHAAGAFWAWVVETGAREGSGFADDFMTVTYEALTADPQPTLDRIAEFIDQRLDYQAILQAGIGSVSKPNTSFPDKPATFQGRWKEALSERRARALEAMLAPALRRNGYQVDAAFTPVEVATSAATLAAYRTSFALRHRMKQTPLARRLVSLELFEPGAVKPLEAGA